MDYNNGFSFIRLNDDDTIHIPSFNNQLRELLSYIGSWESLDEITREKVYFSFRSLVSAAGFYFKQRGPVYWHSEKNRNELFQFLTLYSECLFYFGACTLFWGFSKGYTYCADSFSIFPPEHSQRGKHEAKVKGLINNNQVKLINPTDIDFCCDYLVNGIDKYLISKSVSENDLTISFQDAPSKKKKKGLFARMFNK